jgi:A/G-specific adenine glycosylase
MPETTAEGQHTLSIPAGNAAALRRALLAWYRRHHRKLPWRPVPGAGNAAQVDPYHSLVSEAMLQQTQVATVLPYFQRFIAAFPTVRALADADEQRVLRLWQGLGYYRRARNLHAAAKRVVSDFDGEVPADVQDLLKLPGVGRYTAGAIASIAHGRPAPIVDGNVARVFARLFNLQDPVDRPDVQKQLWAIAEALVPARSPGDFNQALMELGALVCTPKSPACLTCPLRNRCEGLAQGDPERLPVKRPKKKPKAVTHLVVAVRRNGRYLFEQRPATGLWSNMWQLPTWEDVATHAPVSQPSPNSRRVTRGGNPSRPPSPAACDAAAVVDVSVACAWFTDRFGITPGAFSLTHDFTHQTTLRTIRFVVLTADADKGRLRPNTGRWLKLDQLDEFPLPNPQRTAVSHLP